MSAKWVEPRQWDVWIAELGEGVLSEASGPHPVVVVGNTGVFAQLGVIPVITGTTTSRASPTIVRIEPFESGLQAPTYLELHQIRSLAKSPKRFVDRVGSLGVEARGRVSLGLRYALPGVFPSDVAAER